VTDGSSERKPHMKNGILEGVPLFETGNERRE